MTPAILKDGAESATKKEMKRLPRFLPVVHVTSDEQAMDETELALTNGATGVFLIDHRRPFHKLLGSYLWVRTQVGPDPWIGINFLDRMADEACRIMECEGAKNCDGLWVDTCVCRTPNMDMPGLAKLATDCGAGVNWRFFAGTAFKHQRQPDDLAMAAMRVSGFFDVVCTSGPATGHPPAIDKLRQMKDGCGANTPLAVASGVSAENVREMLLVADCFMVATSICRAHDRFDPVKLRELADIIQ